MVKTSILLHALALVSSASAALFPGKTRVKQINGSKDWKKYLKEERAAVVAFVAPWCGHCQKLAPEYSKVAGGMDPLVPFYAVDCDADANKQLCAQQGIKGFPTVKMFPRGIKVPPVEFQMERTAGNLFMWTSRSIPSKIARPKRAWGISNWKFENRAHPRAILLNKAQRVPLLWKVLANKYHDKIKFASARDAKGRVSKQMGFELGGKKESKVIVFTPDGRDAILYKGVMKYEPLVEFLDQLLAGTVDTTQHAVGDEQIVLKAEEEAKAAGSDAEEDDDEDEEEDGKKSKKAKKTNDEL
ncbi:thioredoxin-like protein [Exidia glandulosa HHB12029]|uniref:Thioredoxin-like protein n=1 Tax=Exidia glandulosa HHB12029 TaxID=1314781 RepID=A0A165KSS9_EXIGL|nr:thioredoxin-like protein [Exidia glandulosa HHB12029]